jgi:hypothetical protein
MFSLTHSPQNWPIPFGLTGLDVFVFFQSDSNCEPVWYRFLTKPANSAAKPDLMMQS